MPRGPKGEKRPISFTTTDHRQLDRLIGSILEAFAAKEVTLPQAREAIAHVITAAAIGNEPEVRDWLGRERVGRWKKECQRATGT